MNFADWFTDTFTIKRNVSVLDGNLTRMSLETQATDINGRVYNDSKANPAMKQTAADITQTVSLACDNAVDIKPGDELIITIGGRLGHTDEVYKARAGAPHHYYEPFGAVVPGLAHQEVSLLNMERI